MRSLKKRVTAIACAVMMTVSSLTVSAPVTAKAAEGEDLVSLSIQAAAEGCVMLKNENDALPLQNKAKIALFGRAQNDENYIFGGKGSGSAPETNYKVNILEALEAAKYDMNGTLKKKYADFCKNTNSDNNTDDEAGSKAQNEDGKTQKKIASRREMDWTEDAVKDLKRDNETAIIMISRKSGEDADLAFSKGSFLLTDKERTMLDNVSKVYDKVVVLLNTTVAIDMSWVKDYPKIDSILYVWTGGQEAGNGVVQVLSGEVNPCGKLTDTIAKDYTKYPTKDNYGKLQTFYQEDIYVGYRYFETFAPDDVMYPFGYGLSYTTFDTKFERMEQDNGMLKVVVTVTNTGKVAGKEVVQVYYGAPQAKMGNPVKELAAFAKTKEIYPGESQTLSLNFKISEMASYDDGGYTGHENCYVLEAGEYKIYVGNDVRSSKQVAEYQQDQLEVVEKLQEALAPVTKFKRYKAVEEDGKIVRKEEDVPQLKENIEQRIKDNQPKELTKKNGNKTYKLIDVYNGDVTMEQFVAQMTPEQMGMMAQGSPDVKNKDQYTKGGASYFGGVRCKDNNGKLTYLSELYGIPVAVTADGPGGIKIKEKCTMIPCANVLGCTWNLDLIERMYKVLGDELIEKEVDSLLGPGVNIKRDPRCGRNFEYFSEDPLLTGRIAAVMTKAVQESGATLTAKHFACNNCELSVGRDESHDHIWYMSSIRGWADSIVSERALREIYLKVFEIYVKEGNARSVMTAYNPINGCYAASNYDLNTTILRKEWGYNGIVMTDWWANMSEKPWANGNMSRNPDRRATMLKAQNDVWMTLDNDISYNSEGKQQHRNKIDDILNNHKNGYLTLGELQRSALNICNYLIQSQAFATLNKLDIKEVTKRYEKKTDEWFTVENAQLGNPEMEAITVGGRKLTDFSKNVLRYKVYLPADAATIPKVEATAKSGTTVEVEQATAQNRTAVIKATEGKTTTRYNIEFTDEEGLKPILENPVYASLSDIKVDGTSLEGFAPATYAYKVAVNSLDGEPAVTWTAPEGVTVTKNYDKEKQTVTLKAVSADQAVSYSVQFGVLPHSDEFDGTALNNFWKVENKNDKLDLTDGHLVICGEYGSIWNDQDHLMNRVYQSADGDWEAVVKIDIPKLPSYAYQSLGVVAMQDYDNYVYVKMESNGNGYEISLCQESGGSNKTVETISDTDEKKFTDGMYVKLRKMGTTYMASVSPDGKDYIRFKKAVSGAYENPKFMLVNGNGDSKDVPETLQAKFDYVHFTTEGLGAAVDVKENTKVKVAEVDPVTITAGLVQEKCEDTDGGMNLANFAANEEIAFRINVQKTGYYDLTARIACPEAGLFQFRNSTFVDGVSLGQIFSNDTDGAQNWVDMALGSNVKLTKGEHIVKLHADESGFDIAYSVNWVQFKLTKEIEDGELRAAVAAAKEKLSLYSAEDQKKLAEVIEEAEEVLASTEDKAEFDKALKALKEVEGTLVELGTAEMKAELVSTVETAEILIAAGRGDYAEDLWNKFVDAYEAAKAPKEDATVEELALLKTNLTTAMAALNTEVPGQPGKDPYLPETDDKEKAKSELEKTVKEVKAVIDAEQGDYTDESWNKLVDAYEAAEAGLKAESATKADFDRLKGELDVAKNGLKKDGEPVVPGEDKELKAVKEELTELVKKLGKVVDDGQGNYTSESWKAFVEEVESAEKLLDDESATKADLEKCIDALDTAKAGLKEVIDGPDVPVTPDIPTPEPSAPGAAKYVDQVQVMTDSNTLYIGGDNTTTVRVKLPDGASSQSVNFASSKTSVATVDQSGVVTAKKNGEVVISVNVTLTNGESKAFNVKVTVKRASIKKQGVPKSVKVGKKATLKVKVIGSSKRVTWKIKSGSRYAKLTKAGKFTAKARGKVKVVAKCGKLSKTFTIRVK